MATIEEQVDALLDDPDFAGLVVRYYHCSGDERIQNGGACLAARDEVLREALTHLLQQADDYPDRITVRPVFYR